MASSRWDQVCVALVAAMRARPGYCAPTAVVAGAVVVLDSTEVAMTEPAAERWLAVRWAGDPLALLSSGSTGQALRTIGTNRARDERGTVRCRAVHQGGDVNLTGAAPASWAAAFGVLADVEDLARTSPTLGLVTPRMLVQVAAIDDARQTIAESGLVTEIDFTLTYDTRI